ncbi:MAG: BsaWI family type II restriction enzyme [Candidatus Cloacimonadota bacterium]|nr:BsaWI family type II restriction enzyme [Candidatus Cloacimonadota bacterium]
MAKFTIDNLYLIYNEYKKKYKRNAYKYVSQVLTDAKPLHKKSFTGNDHEQSWRAFKGKNLEKLIVYIIESEVSDLGLKIVDGNKLERTKETNLSEELSNIKRNLLIDYGEFGYHLPDVDIIIYEPKSYKVIAVLSSKITLRERIAQSGYWKLKLSSQKLTKHIRVYFVTPDEDGTLTFKTPAKKGRAIVEVDLDGSYVLSETEIEESNKVKPFEKFIDDLVKFLEK